MDDNILLWKDRFDRMENQQKYEAFRRAYPAFYYHGFSVSYTGAEIHVRYDFEIENLCAFHPTLRINAAVLPIKNAPDTPAARRILFGLGMVELISYWKCACPPRVIIECGGLDGEDRDFWKKLYFNGLGEFFYRNGIKADPDSFLTIEAPQPEPIPAEAFCNAHLNLIPVGGGKDSCVTLELMRAFHAQNRLFMVNFQDARDQCALAAGYTETDMLHVLRTIDPALLERNREGFLNGHTPFSAIVAFLGFYTAYLIGAEHIVLSNESSANEGNISGSHVNHQYSKSFAFERDFQAYAHKNLLPDIHYFSLLRPFNELQIAKFFAALPQYHTVFRSCNAGSKRNVWCCNCAKCLFVCGILSPFLPPEQLAAVFGENLLEKGSLRNIFDGLVGFSPVKPFECVGTQEELCFALALTVRHYRSRGETLPALLDYYAQHVDIEALAADDSPLKAFNAQHQIPAVFQPYIKEMHRYAAGLA